MSLQDLPSRLARLRKAAGLSQEELAEKMKCARSTISNFEHGQRGISVEGLLEYCRIFNVSLDELVLGNPEDIRSEVYVVIRQYQKLSERDRKEIREIINIKLRNYAQE